MPIKGEELLDAAELIAREKNFKVAVKHSLAGGGLAGLTTILGGLALGPIGLAIGGATGGLLGYVACKDSFKPLHEIIANDLTIQQRNKLIAHIMLAFQDFDITDVAKIVSLVMTTPSLQSLVAQQIISFAEKELRLSVQQ